VRAHLLLFARHGESTWNARGLWQGQADPPLSPAGRLQARALGERLAREGAEVFVASDLARARDTARIAARVLGLEPSFDPGLRELDVGTWSGLSVAEVEQRFPEALGRLRARDPELRPGGGESWSELRLRVVASLAAIRRLHAHRRVAVVSHLGVLRSIVPEAELAPGGVLALDLEAAVASLGGGEAMLVGGFEEGGA
jgi:probable phosphoglycerate mutase